MTTAVYVVIVTHNSEQVLELCVEYLAKQNTTQKISVVIVDSGSDDSDYLKGIHPYGSIAQLQTIEEENIGFSRANNLGVEVIPKDAEGVLVIMNPDTFLPPNCVEKALQILKESNSPMVLSGKLLSYDLAAQKPDGKIDTTGIFQKWYGRWYDRGQGEKDNGKYETIEEVKALCGALLCFKIRDVVNMDVNLFDPDFFLYKEDIELGLRLKQEGFKIVYDPTLVAYHCRGWQKKRRNAPYSQRLYAAKSELLLCRKHPTFRCIWTYMKYCLVRYFKL